MSSKSLIRVKQSINTNSNNSKVLISVTQIVNKQFIPVMIAMKEG